MVPSISARLSPVMMGTLVAGRRASPGFGELGEQRIFEEQRLDPLHRPAHFDRAGEIEFVVAVNVDVVVRSQRLASEFVHPPDLVDFPRAEIRRKFPVAGAERGVNVDLERLEAAFIRFQHLRPLLPRVLIEVIVLRLERRELAAAAAANGNRYRSPSRKLPPSSLETGWLRIFPARSHSAMSIPL